MAANTFKFMITIRPEEDHGWTRTIEVVAHSAKEARQAAHNLHPGIKVLAVECETPRWRREIGHVITSEKKIKVGGFYECLEVETPYAVVLVYDGEVHACVSKTKREALYWGVYSHKKHGRLRGTGAMWLCTQQHRVGRKGKVSPDARSTRCCCGAEIYLLAATGDDFDERARRSREAFAAEQARA